MTQDEVARHVAFFQRPELLDTICSRVADGESLIDICREANVQTMHVIGWLRCDSRRERWEEAEGAWKEWMKLRLAAEVKRLSLVDIRRAYAADGSLLPIHDIPDDVARSIESIETNELWDGTGKDRAQVGVVRKVKLTPKLQAIKMLGAELNLFTEKVEHSGKVSLEDIVAGAQEPEKAPGNRLPSLS